MPARRTFLAASVSALLAAQDNGKPVEFVCPMDADVRQAKPGRCPRCGMKLVAGLPDPVEFPVDFSTTPARPKVGQPVRLHFSIQDPRHAHHSIPQLELIHERIFHLFLVDETLQHFEHLHPERDASGVFHLDFVFPAGGMWRLLCDFYPAGATPQLTVKTLLLPGGSLATPVLTPDSDAPRSGANLAASLRLDPPVPLAGEKTMLQYRLSPRDGIEAYLGALGHMLVASADLIDLIHTHPFLIDGGLATPPPDAKLVQFNVIFPRSGTYRIWAQFQRLGVVSTIPFTVAVKQL